MLDSSPPFQESWELGELWQKKNTKVRSKSNQMSIALESKRRHLQATATLQHLHSPGLHRSCIQLDLEEQDFFLPSILSLSLWLPATLATSILACASILRRSSLALATSLLA